MADNAEMFTKIAAMDETQKTNARETKELFDALTACSKERDMSKNAAMRYADREHELHRKRDITHRKTEVAEGVWSAENREMTCSWDGGTCTHGPNKGPTWTFSAEDQTDYYVKGFTDPSKCPTHRKEVRGLKSKARRRSRSRSEESRARSRSNSR
jgi:hypothetical protein